MKNKKTEAIIYFLVAVLLAGLAVFVFIAFKPVGNVAEFSQLNALSWLGHRVGKMPIVIAIALLAIFYFYKFIGLCVKR